MTGGTSHPKMKDEFSERNENQSHPRSRSEFLIRRRVRCRLRDGRNLEVSVCRFTARGLLPVEFPQLVWFEVLKHGAAARERAQQKQHEKQATHRRPFRSGNRSRMKDRLEDSDEWGGTVPEFRADPQREPFESPVDDRVVKTSKQGQYCVKTGAKRLRCRLFPVTVHLRFLPVPVRADRRTA